MEKKMEHDMETREYIGGIFGDILVVRVKGLECLPLPPARGPGALQSRTGREQAALT